MQAATSGYEVCGACCPVIGSPLTRYSIGDSNSGAVTN